MKLYCDEAFSRPSRTSDIRNWGISAETESRKVFDNRRMGSHNEGMRDPSADASISCRRCVPAADA